MFLATSIFNHFARTAPEIFKPLRWLSFGGEAGDADAARMALRSGFAGALVNAYGPTETTTFATWYPVREVPEGAVGVPIGRPIANTTVYILDAALQPVPAGVPGEILIGGDGVALGYLNRPELTAAKFVPDTFGGVPGARLYRTGDLGRFLADGNIEFLGRIDDQIKIRGFRIEPGEVEAAITRHPAIREAAVVCRTDRPGDKRLVAYVVARGTERPAPRDLRAFLEDKLPEFMLPAAFVFLDGMPTTASGKINRKALPEADAAAVAQEKDFVAPRTPVEGALARIWADALHLEKVGVRDNFFELGGHSLLAVRVFTQIEKVFGKRLPLTALFTAPTIEKLAEAVGDKERKALFPPIVAIEKGRGGVPIFGVATADAFIYARLSEHLGASQPFYGLHPQGIIPVEKPVIDMRALAARYADEIRAVRPHGPYRLLGMCAGGIVAYEVAQNLAAGGETVDFVGMIDTAGPFGSWTSALLRMREVNRVLDHAYHHVMTLWTLAPGKRLSYLVANAARIKRKILGQPLPSTGVSKEAPVERAYWMVYNGAYLAALARYKPKPYLGRVALFIASRAESERFSRSRLKWRKFAQGGADIYEVPGIHSEMLADEQARIIAGYLKEHFAKIERGSGDVRKAR
jgi:thioesterase domain-containing protein/acyl carrier protein